MAARVISGETGRRFSFFLLSLLLSLGIAVLSSYLVVVSQNPSPAVKGPATVYGTASP